MKKRILSFVLLASFALLCVVVPSSASTTRKETATLNYRDIQISINGKHMQPYDGSGNVVEPFIVDGTTYLPVRAVSTMFGFDVSWDDNTSTVSISGTPSETSAQQDIIGLRMGILEMDMYKKFQDMFDYLYDCFLNMNEMYISPVDQSISKNYLTAACNYLLAMEPVMDSYYKNNSPYTTYDVSSLYQEYLRLNSVAVNYLSNFSFNADYAEVKSATADFIKCMNDCSANKDMSLEYYQNTIARVW